jgi:hypothetical protein
MEKETVSIKKISFKNLPDFSLKGKTEYVTLLEINNTYFMQIV